MKQRQSNFELLRIQCILLIIFVHTTSQINTGLSAFNAEIFNILECISNSTVACFIMISGYFGINFKWEQWMRIIILTTVYGLLAYLAITDFQSISMDGLARRVFVVPLYSNWFISCYLILMLLAPFLNSFSAQCGKQQFQRLLLIMLVAFSLVPTFFNSSFGPIISGGGKCLTFIIFSYLTGRYIKLHHDTNISRKKTAIVFLTTVLLMYSLNHLATILLHKQSKMFSIDCSILIYVSALAIFYFYKSLSFQSRVINSIATNVLAVYLLEESRIFYDLHLTHVASHAQSKSLIIYMFILTVITFTSSIIIDKVRILLFGKAEAGFIRVLLQGFRYAGCRLKRLVSCE